ncbi:aminoglycoside phosphotransferase family protein [Psychrobacter sp. FDAARGOS_221]|uniref:aminoglycoside phosphotransferase family protein n=1 Tax=Psychrobacter sp. FDAARGOS_221 TaxID=1975705 RepID=UPI000BB539B4|nr:phosphotransferase [Psychrobacter sp. FDAARGOS_221]PNK61411.1 aminoglycoside phosphotransferase [Psychrobacter sp. FDAARGOS_221]
MTNINKNSSPNSAANANPIQAIDIESYHTPERFEQLTAFIESAFPNHQLRIESLPGDASFRRYHRVILENVKQGAEFDPSYIVMDAPPQLESIESFVRIDEMMASHINVPTLLAKDLEQGFLVLQDFGSVEFAHLLADAKVKQDSGRIDELYQWAIDCLIELQSLSVTTAKDQYAVADYDADTLQREMNLFSEWFLPYIDAPLTEEDQQLWQQFCDGLIELLLQHPQVVVHRDYHSRNLMLDQYHNERLGVIDFQDALIGSYAYDLVSLVRDAYVDWSEEQVASWIEYYWQQRRQQGLATPEALSEFVTQVNLIGLQRHLKVLGIFIRLAQRDGKTRYLADIPKVWRDVLVEVQQLSEQANPQVQALVVPVQQWLQRLEPKFATAFA